QQHAPPRSLFAWLAAYAAPADTASPAATHTVTDHATLLLGGCIQLRFSASREASVRPLWLSASRQRHYTEGLAPSSSIWIRRETRPLRSSRPLPTTSATICCVGHRKPRCRQPPRRVRGARGWTC